MARSTSPCASRQFRTIEINGTFYGLQRPESFARWREDAPEGFVFAVKGPRYITHLRRLRDIEAQMKDRMWLEPESNHPVRHAVEIRHESFRDPKFVELLCRHKVALVCADTVEWPRLMDLTAGFVYCRLHGSEELYASGYDDAALDRWAALARGWAAGRDPKDAERVKPAAKQRPSGRDVFVYFDNDIKVRAPTDAHALAKRLGVEAEGAG
ncbi:MAG: DUF72 domain-containing protein [Acidiphilium sp.]